MYVHVHVRVQLYNTRAQRSRYQLDLHQPLFPKVTVLPYQLIVIAPVLTVNFIYRGSEDGAEYAYCTEYWRSEKIFRTSFWSLAFTRKTMVGKDYAYSSLFSYTHLENKFQIK